MYFYQIKEYRVFAGRLYIITYLFVEKTVCLILKNFKEPKVCVKDDWPMFSILNGKINQTLVWGIHLSLSKWAQ
jgi:uncharacterized secreted protein with C-terminal beta-propeller domain